MQELSIDALFLNHVLQELIARVDLVNDIVVYLVQLSIVAIGSVLEDKVVKLFKAVSVVLLEDLGKGV